MSGHDRLIALVRRYLSPEEIARSLVFWDRRGLRAGEPVGPAVPALVAPFDCTVVFVDLAPGANWAHPARYLFIEVDTERCTVAPAAFPPYLADPPDTYVLILRHGERPLDERDFRPAVDKPRGGEEP